LAALGIDSFLIKKNGQQEINPAAPGIIDTHV
jgi:hypothetical protein